MDENKNLKKLVVSSEDLFQSSAENIDYQKIIDNLTEISGAKYAGFNLFDDKNKCYTTVAISASLDKIKKASSIIGIELLGNKWEANDAVETRMRKRSITRFRALHELTDGVVSQRRIKLFSKVFGIGEVVVAKIAKDNIIIGYFVLLMPASQTLVDNDLVEIYTRQVGLALSRKKAEDALKRRLKYELATVQCMRLLLNPENMDAILPRILEIIHNTVGNSRSYVFQNEDDLKLGACVSICAVIAEERTPPKDELFFKHLPYSEVPTRLLETLQAGKYYSYIVEELDELERTFWEKQGIFSILILPIFSGYTLWGFIGFEDFKNKRQWYQEDINLLQVVADGIGEAILHRKAEEELKESEAKLSSMIENIADVIAITDKDGINKYKSPNIEKWFGWTQEEVIGASIWDRIHPDDLEHMKKTICHTILSRPKATITSESRYHCKDGSYKWIEFTATNLLHDPVIKGILLNYRDVNVRKRAIDALQDSERKFRDYIEKAPHGIFTMDENNRYIEVNKNTCTLTGYSEEELLGMNVIDLIAPECRNMAHESFEELKNTGFTSVELLLVRKDGSVRWIRRDANKLSDNRYLVFSSDIAEKKKAEHSLIQAKMLAEENNRIKSEFLANISHELRTPLTTIIGFSELLSTCMYGDLNEKQLAFTNHIERSGKHLLEIINDVLDLSKIEAGKMELDCSLFSLSETFEEMLTLMSPIAIRKKIDLTLENSARSTEIFADKLKFKQIMYNLLSNAIKFTPDNGRVSVVAKQMDNIIQISVSDTGIGIPSHKLEEIFDPFTQVDSSTIRKYGGTGLGLALVKKFVELHKGKIWVESEEGKGSTFTFTLVEQVRGVKLEYTL
ncbi:PAS domain S-box protein [uncultured Methanomethylovorans sp.]|uniref:PAS domain S-box protein n=1 Tax=uncultured Methanomethylovorans sp. TaxID=183759 RepID=UPI002AA896D7|nr:PAS domain S-box protein [uncultured Methanomethylovorans sp.]